MDKIKKLCENWDAFGRTDPLWAIASHKKMKGNKWDIDEFFLSGKNQIDKAMKELKLIDIELKYTIALDFGCGVGRLSQGLAYYFDKVVGIDVAPSMIELANKYNKFGYRCQYYTNQKNDLSIFKENTFDFIYSADVLQHIDPKIVKLYLKELIRVLKLKGTLMFQMPSDNKKITRKIAYKLGIINRVIGLTSCLKGVPLMEYHYIKKESLEDFIITSGGFVKSVIPDPRSNGVMSYYYIAIKV